MSEPARLTDQVPDQVPTLTEVVRSALPSPERETFAGHNATPVLDEAQIVSRVLAALQCQIDPALDSQLRAALAPALARATELLVHELRLELVRTLRELVARAVAQELARALKQALPLQAPR